MIAPAGLLQTFAAFGRVAAFLVLGESTEKRKCQLREAPDRLICIRCTAQSDLSSLPRCRERATQPLADQLLAWIDTPQARAAGSWAVICAITACVCWVMVPVLVHFWTLNY